MTHSVHTEGAAGAGPHRFGTLQQARVMLNELSESRTELEHEIEVLIENREFLLEVLSEHKRMERALRESEEQYRHLVQASTCVILRMDAQGRITFFNEYARKFFGYSEQEVLGRPVVGLLLEPRESTGRNLAAMIEDLLRRPAAYEYNENENVCKDGHRVWVAWTNRPIYDAEGKLKEILSVGMDVTARERADQALEQVMSELARSNHELEQFAYVASHDLQEPLRMVSSYLQLIQSNYQDRLDQDGREFIQFALDGAKRMQGLILDLLSYSRLGRSGNGFEPADCHDLLAKALANLRLRIEETGATITHDPLPWIHGDRSQLPQLFQNLLGNAIKFRQEGRPVRIHVGAQRQGSEWLFWVRDNGIGIKPQHHERIFRIFQRLHNRQQYAGTGIGLAVCKKIVEMHGGRIWVESEVGQGSTFYFTIPDPAEQASGVPAAEFKAEPAAAMAGSDGPASAPGGHEARMSDHR